MDIQKLHVKFNTQQFTVYLTYCNIERTSESIASFYLRIIPSLLFQKKNERKYKTKTIVNVGYTEEKLVLIDIFD